MADEYALGLFRTNPRAVAVLRQDAGLAAIDVAASLNVSSAAVSMWESGQRLPSAASAGAYIGLVAQAARCKLATLPIILAACEGELPLGPWGLLWTAAGEKPGRNVPPVTQWAPLPLGAAGLGRYDE